MGKLFGTDGVRGVANRELTPELAFKLGRVGAWFLSREAKRPRVLIGRDTRVSGNMLEAALIAGICSVGGEVLSAGILPTPAIAYLSKTLEVEAGIMISASHNPVEDNGIKFFAGNGYKLPDEIEEKMEKLIMEPDRLPRPAGKEVGQVEFLLDAVDRYAEHVKGTISIRLDGLKIVVDGANGAASYVAPAVLKELGAKVLTICCEPDGYNINKNCGSTHPELLQKAVIEHHADIGLAYDGDADRLIVVDEKGNLVDGDNIMVICGLDLKRSGRLVNNLIVVTVMSNLGLSLALQKEGIEIAETKVGDRYVLEEMLRRKGMFGGEQSGHVIFLEHATTGDGLLTSLQLLAVMKKSCQPLSVLAGQMVRMPQVLQSVRVKDKNVLETNELVKEAVEKAKEFLAGRGRILVRPSGTEPLVRVMVEGTDEAEIKKVATRLATVIRDI